MSILTIIDGFKVNINKPIDNRFVVGPGQFYADKNEIAYKYTGLRIWDLNDETAYFWDGSNWTSETSTFITGSGTSNTIVKFTGSKVIGDSSIRESAGKVGIGGSPGTETLKVYGDLRTTNRFYGIGTNITQLNASNINSGVLQLSRLENGTSEGQILISGTSSPIWTDDIKIGGTAPIETSAGVKGILYFKSYEETKIYSNSTGLSSELLFSIGSEDIVKIDNTGLSVYGKIVTNYLNVQNDLHTDTAYVRKNFIVGQKGSTTNKPTVVNAIYKTGWSNYGGSWPSAHYYREGSFVHIDGMVINSSWSSSNKVIFTLNLEYRPAQTTTKYTPCFGDFGSQNNRYGVSRITIYTNGNVELTAVMTHYGQFTSGNVEWLNLNLDFSIFNQSP